MIDKFLDCMKNRGWTVETNKEQKFCLPEPMKSRYTGYPESWVEFVSTVKSMIRGDDSMKKQLIPGTKIVKVIAGKDNNGEKLRKDLEKIGKIELLGKSIKNIFSI